MRNPAIRWLTALVVTGLCLWIFTRGWQIVRFEFASQMLADSTNRAETLRPWINVSGVSFDARVASLTPIRNSRDRAAVEARREELVQVLSRRPLSAEYWLSLSVMRLSTGQPTEKVMSALLLSSLTGANEGDVITKRGVYGVSVWEILPPDLRQRTISDLTEALKFMPYQPADTKREYQVVIAGKSEQTRQAIRNELLAAGGMTQELLTAVGF